MPAKSYWPPPPSGAPWPNDHGDKVIAEPPGACRIGSTPDNRVTAVIVALPASGCEATIITASPTFRSAIVLLGNRLTSCERSPPADRPAPPGLPAPPGASPPCDAGAPAPPAFAASPFALAANLAAASAGSARTFEFAVITTVTVFFVVRSFSVTVPFEASMVAIKPARFLNDPLTISSA